MSLIGERVSRGSTSVTVTSNIEAVFEFLSSIERIAKQFFGAFIASYDFEDGVFTASFYIRHIPGATFIRFLRARAVSARSMVKLKFSTNLERPKLIEHIGTGDLDRVVIRFNLSDMGEELTRITMLVEISYKDEPEWVPASLLKDIIDSFNNNATRILAGLPTPVRAPKPAPKPKPPVKPKEPVKKKVEVKKPVAPPTPSPIPARTAPQKTPPKAKEEELRIGLEDTVENIGSKLYDPLYSGLIALESEVVSVKVYPSGKVDKLLSELIKGLDMRSYLFTVTPQPSRRWELRVLVDGKMVVGIALESKGAKIFGRGALEAAKAEGEVLGISIARIPRELVNKIRG